MGGFKRFLLIIFVLAAGLCLAALALPWFGPFQGQAAAMMDNWYYFIGVQVALAITLVGVVVTLLRALFTPRKRKTVVVDRSGGDQITVTTAAISSQATHVIEDGDRFVAEKVRVSAKRGGKVRVDVRVRPRHTVDISREGKELHDAVTAGLSTICGEKVKHVNLEFVEAELPEPAQNVLVERIDDLQVPQGVFERAKEEPGEEGHDITVPMGVPAAGHDEALEPDAIEGEVE